MMEIERRLLATKLADAVWEELFRRKHVDEFFLAMDGYVFKDIGDALVARFEQELP